MSEQQRQRHQQLLREAEGYLELAVACEDRFPLTPPVRHRLAERTLSSLEQIEAAQYCRVHYAYLRGQALRALERYSEAIISLSEAAEFDPDNIHVWLALGWCNKRVGRLDLAIESLERGMEADPSQGILYFNLACYWSLAGNVKLALAYLTKAFDIDPSYRNLVGSEQDFDPIRDDPRFMEATSVIV